MHNQRQFHSELVHSFDGETLFVQVSSVSSSQPHLIVICIHGLGGDSVAWQPILSILKERFPCTYVTFDLRGQGQSTRIFPQSESNYYDVNTKDLLAICQHFPHAQLVLVGHSWGGMLVQEFINRYHPKNIKGCIFISTYPHLFPGFFSLTQKLFYKVLTQVNPQNKLTHLRVRNLSDHYQYKNHPDLSITRIFSDIRAMGLGMYIMCWLSALGWKNTRWKEFDQPENVYIYGTRDQLVLPAYQKKLARKSHLMKFRAIESNHNPLINNTEELAEVLLQDLNDLFRHRS